ncbi:MAG TPA: sodium:dicarboxylate symporter [Pelagibacterium sp.]|nr:sodium:dicarboxylate symporter [Pelagibacterium sp.]
MSAGGGKPSENRLEAFATGEIEKLDFANAGTPAAEAPFYQEDGSPGTLADYQGKVILVNFWATWCAPCREEMPFLDALEAQYGGDDFEVVAISLDIGADGPTAAALFLEEIGAQNLKLFADPSYKLFERLRNEAVTLGLPATILVDDEGCELAVLQGPAHWDTPDGHAVIETLLDI